MISKQMIEFELKQNLVENTFSENFLRNQIAKANQIIKEKWEYKRKPLLEFTENEIRYNENFCKSNSNFGIAEHQIKLKLGSPYFLIEYSPKNHINKSRNRGFSFTFTYWLMINLINLKWICFHTS